MAMSQKCRRSREKQSAELRDALNRALKVATEVRVSLERGHHVPDGVRRRLGFLETAALQFAAFEDAKRADGRRTTYRHVLRTINTAAIPRNVSTAV